ncbi:hypothetical protein DS830_05465 [Bombilactobacillus bombi]|uniref:WxL domain-containing protein n=1 Tax=Bombilactobacillus bombi TaxID=1303590 RepID=UPI000E5852FB|nr:WxL domain-containing protein [Bombilactobacillus bombi]AXX64948.1 hypothetical protein DS830_05465 [Bombilactobacillus bombi]
MKMNKLFSSIAASAMVLTALAPAAVANAASGNPMSANGSGVDPYTGNAPLGKGMATSAAQNVQDGSATAESDASVNVIDGFLVLRAVPDFAFGVTAADQTISLFDNKSLKNHDGNKAGLLTVVDSRHSDGVTTTKDGMGFRLTAKMGSFTDGTNSSKDFVLNLPSVNDNSKKYALNSTATALVTDKETNVVTAPEKASYGNHTFEFAGPNSGVTLDVPDVAAGQYNATIDWTLYGKAV